MSPKKKISVLHLLLFPTLTASIHLNQTYSVSNQTNVEYGQGLTCTSSQLPQQGCKPMSLKLDVYLPQGDSPTQLRPAYILSHGGGNVGGVKEQGCFQGSARFFAARGFAAFNIDYRLAGQHGKLPAASTTSSSPSFSSSPSSSPASSSSSSDLLTWTPNWQSGYPAVRDLKAAIRYVRANAAKYQVDPTRIVVSGGSAGATNSLAAGVTFDGDYRDELTVAEDPTLATTNLHVNDTVQCVVSHWASDGEVELAAAHHPPAHLSRYSKANAPVIEFHGSVDTTIPIAHAKAVQAEYAKTGVPYELHVLEGCAHGPWCYNGQGACGCKDGTAGYNDYMDRIALPFVAKALGLPLQ
eukprot:g4682.t1